MARQVVLGVDSGTQSTKVLAVDLESGEVVGEGRAPHSGADIQHPDEWWVALRQAVAASAPAGTQVAGIAVAGQQHGCVLLDERGEVVRPAALWNNVAAAPDAARLNEEADFAAIAGTRLVASITIAKLAHLARTAPEDLQRTAAVCLPHDWLNFRLTGQLATDRGDASGSGWWSPIDGQEHRELLALAVGESAAARLKLPDVRGSEELAGTLTEAAASALGLPAGIPVGPGTGDNMAAALGLGTEPGELAVSLGTSGTAFIVSDRPTADPTGEVAGFADATGRFLPLACMLNCTRILDSVAGLLGIDRLEALVRADAVAPGAGGLLLLPYFGGERTPNLPEATGLLSGITDRNLTPDRLLRAAVDGVAAGIAYCVEALARLGLTAPAVTLTGGGAAHPTWQQAIADATGLPVTVRAASEHAARGVALQIAAIVRHEPLLDLMARWRPPIVAERAPRPAARAAFDLDRRRQLIQTEELLQRRVAEASTAPLP